MVWIWAVLGIDKFQGYKDCPDYLYAAPIMVGSKKIFWFLDVLKRSTSELTLPEKTLEGIKTVEFVSGDHGEQYRFALWKFACINPWLYIQTFHFN